MQAPLDAPWRGKFGCGDRVTAISLNSKAVRDLEENLHEGICGECSEQPLLGVRKVKCVAEQHTQSAFS
jgi:hypothetical protein